MRTDSNKIVFQLSLATALSLAGVAASIYWYDKTTPAFDDGSNQSITGYLQDSSTEVDRKPSTRLMWRPVSKGEALYGGDTIRTSASGDSQIFLNFGGRIITLDPDSVIVLEEKQGEVSLDLVSGSLFIKKSNAAEKFKGKAPRIKIGSSTVSVNSTDTELSLSLGKDGKPSVAVAKGSVDIVAADKKVSVSEGRVGNITNEGVKEEPLIEVLSPVPDEVHNVGPSGRLPIAFKWKPLASDKVVFLEIGSDKNFIKKVDIDGVVGSKGVITFPVPIGTFYWRLKATQVGTSSAIQQSIVHKGVVVSIAPPSLVEPEADQKYVFNKDQNTVTMSWTASKYLENQSLTIASDAAFKKVVESVTITGTNAYSFHVKNPGVFYWRVIAHFGNATLASPAKRFSIEKSQEVETPKVAAVDATDIPAQPPQPGFAPTEPEKILQLAPPEFISSTPRLRAKNDGTMLLQWHDVEGAEKYSVIIVQSKTKKTWTQESRVNKLLLTKLMPGKYQVKVGAFNKNEELGPFGVPKVLEVPSIGALKPPAEVKIKITQ